MPSIHVYNWKLLFKVHDYVLLGSCPELPCWKRYSQKTSGYVTGTPNFPENEHFLTADTHTYLWEMLVFRKIWRASFSCIHRFEICPFALLGRCLLLFTYSSISDLIFRNSFLNYDPTIKIPWSERPTDWHVLD